MDTRRKALLEAMVRVVGEKGYKATSVADVIEAADTSRSTFYKHFDDKHDCFLAAYDMIAGRVMGEVVANCDGRQPWLVRMERGLATIVELFAIDPYLARTAVVEVVAAGADARRRHWEALTRLADSSRRPGAGREPRAAEQHGDDGRRRRLRPDLRRAAGEPRRGAAGPLPRSPLCNARPLPRPSGRGGGDAAGGSDGLGGLSHSAVSH